MLPKNVLYYGREEALPAQTELRAGPLSLIYEAGNLRAVRLGAREILNRVYVAVRDHNWGTVPPVLSNVQLEAGADSFRIGYDATHRQGEIDFVWRGTISGDAQGTITFRMDGEARATFRRNRIGFCILHPSACAGAPCRIERVDGGVEASAFPLDIAPQLIVDGTVKPVPPFAEMRALSHEVAPGLWAEVRFEGDVFELEDQRNWTDASYKTYCPPLRLPFPVVVEAGAKISQSVTLRLRGELPARPAQAAVDRLTFALGASPAGPLPRLGLGVASHGRPLGETELARLKAMNLSHLRVDLNLAQPGYEAALRRAAAEAAALDAALEVALHLTGAADTELKALRSLADVVRPPVWAWLVFHQGEKSTGERWLRLARLHLSSYDPAAEIGGGTDVYFTDLNRGHPPLQALDLVSYALNPQVHAFDNLSLVETLEVQGTTVASARRFCGDLPIAVSPVTLKPRFNPNATGPEPEPPPGELPPQVDVRQMSLFGAGWTAGSLKYLAAAGAHSLTYYETIGWRGVMETEAGSPLPDKFRSLPGSVFPLYHVLADVGAFAGGELLPATSSRPLLVDGLALRKNGRTRVILANLSPEPQPVTVENLGRLVRLCCLDETNVEAAMRAPEAFRARPGDFRQTTAGRLEINLRPYAIARIDD